MLSFLFSGKKGHKWGLKSSCYLVFVPNLKIDINQQVAVLRAPLATFTFEIIYRYEENS